MCYAVCACLAVTQAATGTAMLLWDKWHGKRVPTRTAIDDVTRRGDDDVTELVDKSLSVDRPNSITSRRRRIKQIVELHRRSFVVPFDDNNSATIPRTKPHRLN